MSAGAVHLRRALIVAAAAWLAVGIAGHAGGYVLNGQKWASSSVPFYVNPSNNDVTPDAAIAALDKAATTWAAQSGASVRLFLAGTTSGSTLQNNGKNEVFFRNESAGTTGASTYYYYSGGTITDADIKFYDGGIKFYTGTTGCTGGFYIEDIATHEFGHVLGLGHSPISTATMYPSINGCTTWARTLDADDIAGVLKLYSSLSLQAPAAPYSLTASGGSNAVSLAWVDASSNEGGFRVERASGGGSYGVVASLPAGTRSWLNSGLASGATYSYRVQAYNSAGSSGYSNTATATTSGATSAPAAPAAPGSPSPPHGATGVQTSTVAWSAAARATSYQVYFGTSSTPPFYQQTSGTSVPVGKLTPGVTHYWRVVAVNSAGSASGPTWRFTTKARGWQR